MHSPIKASSPQRNELREMATTKNTLALIGLDLMMVFLYSRFIN